jgi:hypothetical protein
VVVVVLLFLEELLLREEAWGGDHGFFAKIFADFSPIFDRGSKMSLLFLLLQEPEENVRAPREIRVTKAEMTIGREEGDIAINSGEISRVHARLEASSLTALSITDLGSLNGVFVNGTRVAPQQAVALSKGQVISFGAKPLNKTTPLVMYKVEEDSLLRSRVESIEHTSEARRERLIKVRESLDIILECPLCYLIKEDLVTLTCGHTMCKQCCTNWFMVSRTWNCSHCRAPSRHPPISLYLVAPACRLLAEMRSDPLLLVGVTSTTTTGPSPLREDSITRKRFRALPASQRVITDLTSSGNKSQSLIDLTAWAEDEEEEE